MNTKLLKASFLIGVSSLLVACNSQPVKQAQQPYWMAFVQDRHTKVDVVNVVEGNGPAGEIKLGITFASVSTKTATGQFNLVWYDQSGTPINTILSRQTPMNLMPKEQRTVSVISPGPRASSYEIIIEK